MKHPARSAAWIDGGSISKYTTIQRHDTMIPVIFIAFFGCLTLAIARWNYDPATDFPDRYM